jgi:hypothetical protein
LFSRKEAELSGPSSRVDRVLVSGPLAEFVDAYSAELATRGYWPLTVVGELGKCGG